MSYFHLDIDLKSLKLDTARTPNNDKHKIDLTKARCLEKTLPSPFLPMKLHCSCNDDANS